MPARHDRGGDPSRGRVRSRGSGTGRASSEFGEASVDSLVVVLSRAGTVTGTVLDASGVPLGGAEIIASLDAAAASLENDGQVLELFGLQLRRGSLG